MAKKSKGKGGNTKPVPASAALAKAAKAGDAHTALMAVSTAATEQDSTNSTIFQCVVSTFDDQGLNHISSQTAKIVWVDIPDPVIAKLGHAITVCLAAKGINIPELGGAFQNLNKSNQVTVVSDLVTAIAQLAE